jgi:yeast amino acid transporter
LKDNWDTATFITNYLPLVLFPILYMGARLWRKQGPIKPEDMDFVSGIAEIEATTYDEPEPTNIWERFWRWVVCCRYQCPTKQVLMYHLADVKGSVSCVCGQ